MDNLQWFCFYKKNGRSNKKHKLPRNSEYHWRKFKNNKAIKKGIKKISEPAARLLRLYILGDASALLGKDRDGHYFRDNLLYIPEWRRGLTPGEIRALF